MRGLLSSGKVEAFEFEFSKAWKDGWTPKEESLVALLSWLRGLATP